MKKYFKKLLYSIIAVITNATITSSFLLPIMFINPTWLGIIIGVILFILSLCILRYLINNHKIKYFDDVI